MTRMFYVNQAEIKHSLTNQKHSAISIKKTINTRLRSILFRQQFFIYILQNMVSYWFMKLFYASKMKDVRIIFSNMLANFPI